MTQPADNLAAVPARPRRRRRWLLRIPIILVATVITIIVFAQIFLWTDYPRQIAESQVQRILNVRTSIKRVSIGWLGHTRIEGVELTLPMESEPFLRVAQIDAEHASLPAIAFDQELSAVRINGVEFIARQDEGGRWNVQQLLAPRSKTPEPAAKPVRNPLASVPAVEARDVRATLVRSDGKRLDLPVLEVDLKKPDGLIATLSAHAGDVLAVDGELGQSTALPQALHVKFNEVPADVAAFFGIGEPPAVTADVNWEGQLTGSGVSGSASLVDVRAQKTRAVGRVDVDVDENGVTAKPRDLNITLGDGSALQLLATAGQVHFEKTLTLKGVSGTLNGGRFAVDGTLDPATLIADVSAKWEQVTRDSVATTGSARLRTATLFNGNIQIDADARGGARLADGEAVGAAALSGEASLAGTFEGSITLDPFTWTPVGNAPPIVTPRLDGRVSITDATATLEARSANDPRAQSLSAFAGADRATQQWWATLDVSSLRLPELEAKGLKGPIDLSVAATGAGARINIEKGFVKLEKGSLYVRGNGELTGKQPLSLAVWASYDKPVTEDEAAQLNSLKLTSVVSGTLAPRELKADVELSGSELVFAGRRIGDVALQLTGALGAEEATVESQELEAFGGHWSLRGRWSERDGGPPTVLVRFRDIPMENLGELAERDDLGGVINTGSATLRIRSSRLDQVEMNAAAHGTMLSVGPLRAESLDLTATLAGGKFEVKPTLREDGGTLTAQLQGDVTLANPIQATLELQEWPAPYVMSTAAGAERFRPRASGKASVDASLRTGDISGDVAVGGIVERGDAKLADFRLEAAMREKRITVSRATIGTLDGTLSATGQLDLANLNATVVNATFDRLTPSLLAWSNPILGEVQGQVNGTMALRPSVAPRAMGPIELELNVRPEGMAFRGVNVGDFDMLAYADLKSPEQFRFVTERAVLNLAGGRIEPFARITMEPGRGLAQLVTANFRDIDLGELVRAADNDGKDLVGKLAGRVQLFGQTTNLKTLTGDATIRITDSDLANFGPIAALYNALSIGTAGSEPNGSGSISLRIGGDAVTIDDANYFNRGVYANAFGAVRGLSDATEAQVDDALVVGSLQPLRAVKLPFFGDLNDTLAALQSSVTAIQVSGPLKEPKMEQVTIGSLSETFQKVLLGKMKDTQ